jgi:hypothetical protein
LLNVLDAKNYFKHFRIAFRTLDVMTGNLTTLSIRLQAFKPGLSRKSPRRKLIYKVRVLFQGTE